MDIKDIQNLIKFVAKSGVHEVKLEMEDVKITIKTASAPKESGRIPVEINSVIPPTQVVATSPQPVAPPTTAPETNVEKDVSEERLITIKSPIIGTFYRKSAPENPHPFVSVGDVIKTGDVLCVIEAMKLFNEIESEVSGKIVKILVDDASPVEFEQDLFIIDPS